MQLSTRLILFFTFIVFQLSAQIEAFVPEISSSESSELPFWAKAMYESPSSLEEIQKLYKEFYAEHDFVKNQHTQYYKRLVRKHARVRTGISANTTKDQFLANDKKYLKTRSVANSKSPIDWMTVGPFDLDIDAPGTGNTPGTAHVFHIDYCIGLSQHMLAGTATAGLWKSSNAGQSWDLLTKDLPVNQVKAAAYEPSNPSTIYFAANNNFYKTENGGNSWNITGGTVIESSFFKEVEIIVNPDQTNQVFLATNIGLFKSSDSGENFDLKESGSILDIEFHPVDKSIIYLVKYEASRTIFYKSTDAGENFTSYETGWPIPSANEEQKRTVLSVSAAEPESVWALAVGKINGSDGLVGIYKSADGGASWQRKCCGDSDGGSASAANPNIMEWECGGTKNGGQYYYDLALAVNPANTDQLLTGGINLWRSEDGGANMSCLSDYIHSHNPDTYVHADIHSIKYIGDKVWIASDGGIFCSADQLQSFDKKMNGLVGTDFRGFDVGFFNKDIMVGGTYHNGTFLKENDIYINDWVSTRSGDNSRAFVNRGDNSIIYDHSSMRELSGDRMKLPHNIGFSRQPNASFVLGESSEIVVDPFDFNKLYVGQSGNLYVTMNNGVSFERLKAFGAGLVTSIEVSATIEGLIYVVYYPSFSADKKVMRSVNGGITFEDVTPPSSMFNDENMWVAMDISIGSHYPYEIWMARIPQTTNNLNLDGAMIFHSTNGGDTWENWTTPALNGEFPTNIVHQKGSDGLVYLGTRRAVYYRSNTSGDWQLYSSSLPASTFSTKLIPHYLTGKLINATQRGVYEVDFAETNSPKAIPSVDKRSSACLRDTFYFQDISPVIDNSATRLWTFEGAEVVNSTARNPKVTYAQAGVFSVKLELTSSSGSSSFYNHQFISVNDGCRIDSIVGNSIKVGNNAYAQVPAYKKSFSEMTITAWVKRQGIIYNSAGIVVHRDGPTGTGLIIRSDGQLSYLWDEVSNTYNSNSIVPFNKWSHVAMTASPTGIKLYVDGKETVHNIALSAVELLENFYLGADQFSASNYLSGYMDEVCIYDRALSSEEILLKMNLTQLAPDPHLLSYFQANNSTGKLTDRVGHQHAYMMHNATRVGSMAPVASGCSESHEINLPGTYDFDCANVSLTYEPGDILPMGEVSVTKLFSLPDMAMPQDRLIGENYWIFNNTGTNASVSPPSKMIISDFGYIDSMYLDFPERHEFYQVPNYWEYGWGTAFDTVDSLTMENNTSFIFNDVQGMSYYGKLILAQEGFPPLSSFDLDLSLSADPNHRRFLDWNLGEQIYSYEIFRADESLDFKKLAQLNHRELHENQTKYIDKDELQGKVYYRVIATDFQSKEYVSDIVEYENSKRLDLRYYPTVLTTYDILTIDRNNREDLTVSIYDTHGRQMHSSILKEKRSTLELNLEAGHYFLEFVAGDEISHGRIVVQ